MSIYFLCQQKKHRGSNCLFHEEYLESGFTRYRSAMRDAEGNHRYMGFTKKGKFMRENREKKLRPRLRKCFDFLKVGGELEIDEHNRRVAGNPGASTGTSWTPSLCPRKESTSAVSTMSHNTAKVRQPHPSSPKIRHRHHHHHNVNEIT